MWKTPGNVDHIFPHGFHPPHHIHCIPDPDPAGPMNRKIMNSTALNYDKAWLGC